MLNLQRFYLHLRQFGLAICVLILALTGCAVGPKFVRPTPDAPDDWTSWRSADDSLRAQVGAGQPLPSQWWQTFNDPVLESMVRRALTSSPDLRTAALHFAQARVQRSTTAAQRGPEVGVSASANRQRQSEYGAGTRIIDAISSDRAALVNVLSEPFTLYQGGFDVSWEPDLWGRIRRSIEAADANVDHQAALLELAWLTLASDVARN